MSSVKHVCLHGHSKTPEIPWNSYTFNEVQYARKKETLVTKKKSFRLFKAYSVDQISSKAIYHMIGYTY